MSTPKTVASLSEILPQVPRNSRIFIGSGCAEPQELVRQLVENAHYFADAEIFHLLTAGRSDYVDPQYRNSFRHNAFFIGANAREAVTMGEADYTPIFLYVVTEYGIAYLYGKSVRQRSLELINIAHPDFRGELLDAMKARHYVYTDQKLETIGRHYPQQYETTQSFKDTGPIPFRPIKPTDERMLQDFFYSHNEETIYLRYHAVIKNMPHDKAQYLVNVDYKNSMAFVGVIGEPGKERIIAIARYMSKANSNFPEIAFVVHENYRGKGIASFLLQQLIRVAKSNGFEGFIAYVLPKNTSMLRVFDRLALAERKFEDGVFKLTLRFENIMKR